MRHSELNNTYRVDRLYGYLTEQASLKHSDRQTVALLASHQHSLYLCHSHVRENNGWSQSQLDRSEAGCISSMHAQTLGNLCNCLAVKSDQLLAIGCSAVNVQPLMLSSHKRVTILLTANTIFTPCLKIILLFVHQNSTFKDKRSNEHTSGRFCNGGLETFSCGFPRYQPAVSSEGILSFAFHFWQNLQQMENFFTCRYTEHTVTAVHSKDFHHQLYSWME